MGEMINTVLSENLKRRDILEDLGIDMRMLLKFTAKKYFGQRELNSW
jgi:hypothetical protein